MNPVRPSARLAWALTFVGVLAGCGGSGYAGKAETSDDLTGSTTTCPVANLSSFAFANTGKFIQQLVVTANTHHTLAIRKVTACLEVDQSVTAVDYRQGPLYLPGRVFHADTVYTYGSTRSWLLGDLPRGYRAVVTFSLRHLKPIPHRGYVIDVKWYAMTSSDQPRRTWHDLGGWTVVGGV